MLFFVVNVVAVNGATIGRPYFILVLHSFEFWGGMS